MIKTLKNKKFKKDRFHCINLNAYAQKKIKNVLTLKKWKIFNNNKKIFKIK